MAVHFSCSENAKPAPCMKRGELQGLREDLMGVHVYVGRFCFRWLKTWWWAAQQRVAFPRFWQENLRLSMVKRLASYFSVSAEKYGSRFNSWELDLNVALLRRCDTTGDISSMHVYQLLGRLIKAKSSFFVLRFHERVTSISIVTNVTFLIIVTNRCYFWPFKKIY